jgi:hypothetical protein
MDPASPSRIHARAQNLMMTNPASCFYGLGVVTSSHKQGSIIMKKLSKTLVMGIAILSIAAMTQFVWTDMAAACGWGQSGGGDYVPQRRDSSGFLARKSAVSEEQARDIVSGYVKKLNPNLEIGKVTDNGGFYEVEIVDAGNEIVQLLGVDKLSGRLIVLN